MIDLLEIRDKSRAVIGVIDTASSVIWNIKYFGVGDFEIYIPFTAENNNMLQVGHYVTRQNERNIGIIEHISIFYSAQDGRMITASGRFAKSLLDRRIIYDLRGHSITPVISRGNVEQAARALVKDCLITATDTARNIDFVELGALNGYPATLPDQKQTSYSNLLEYTDKLLQEYDLASYFLIDRKTLQLQYTVYSGADRSISNTSGNDPLIFSQEHDNLLSSDYNYNEQAHKNAALIGGAGEGIERFMQLMAGNKAGIDRREVFIDAIDQSRTYKDGETDNAYTDAEYIGMLTAKATQSMKEMGIVDTMAGEIDITNSGLQLDIDFYVGDIITIQDNELQKYVNSRITKVVEVQDESGYMVNIEFGE